jgi:phospholipase C
VLGAWDDSRSCYYHDEYLEGINLKKQTWVISNIDNPGQPLRYGGKVIIHNLHFRDQRLSQDNRIGMSQWVTTRKDGDYWTIEPGPVGI